MDNEIDTMSQGSRLAAIWPMPHDHYWILMTCDFGTEKFEWNHYNSEADAREVGRGWVEKG